MWNLSSLSERFPLLRSPAFAKLLVLLVGGVLLLVMASSWTRGTTSNSSSSAKQPQTTKEAESLTPSEQGLEKRLEMILCAMKGAGNVEVTVTLATGTEYTYAHNTNDQKQTVEEKDQGGGTRTTTDTTEQNTLVFSQGESGSSDTPVVVSQTSPEIAGVLVLADGANDPVLKEKLVQAVETVLDLPAYKVIVLPRKGG